MGPHPVRDRFDPARLINVANGLTAGRVVLVPVIAWLLIAERFRPALWLFVACGASDLLDGLLARALRQRTVVGFYLDPMADKLLMATSFVVLAIVRVVPEWLAVLVISRDIFILFGSLIILLLIGPGEIAVTSLSKVNTFVQVATVVSLLALRAYPGHLDAAVPGAERLVASGVTVLCAVTTAASGIQYLAVGIGKLSRA